MRNQQPEANHLQAAIASVEASLDAAAAGHPDDLNSCRRRIEHAIEELQQYRWSCLRTGAVPDAAGVLALKHRVSQLRALVRQAATLYAVAVASAPSAGAYAPGEV